mgnify:CR=1 FL=1
MELKQFERLENYLRMYAGGHIDEHYHFLRNGTDEQKKDLLSFIIYTQNNYIGEIPYSFIRTVVIHDILGINKNDIHFVPHSAGYSNSITNL